jgi:hypothetical protein
VARGIAASVGTGTVFKWAAWLVGRISPAGVRRPWQIAGSMADLVLIVPLFVPYAEMVAKSWRVGQITFLKDHEIDYPYPIADPKRPEQTAKRIAAKIEDNSIIFADWGILWAIAYVTHVEQSRTGISRLT